MFFNVVAITHFIPGGEPVFLSRRSFLDPRLRRRTGMPTNLHTHTHTHLIMFGKKRKSSMAATKLIGILSVNASGLYSVPCTWSSNLYRTARLFVSTNFTRHTRFYTFFGHFSILYDLFELNGDGRFGLTRPSDFCNFRRSQKLDEVLVCTTFALPIFDPRDFTAQLWQ